MNTSKYIQNLEDMYCHSRSVVTSESNLNSGSTSLPTRIINGGKKVLYTAAMTGMLLNNTVPAYADLTVYAGQTSSGLTVGKNPGNIVQSNLFNYGRTIDTIVNSAGTEYVYNGGTAINTTIQGGGTQIIQGGSTTGTTVAYNGTQIISGGIATDTNISLSGIQHISNGGSAINTTVGGGGKQFISNGGTAINTIISYASQTVSSGGTAISTTVTGYHASQIISSGGTATNTTIANSAVQYVYSGGSATSTTVNNVGKQYVNSGVTVTNTTLNSGGSQFINSDAIAMDTIINDYGYQRISSGGTAINTNVQGGSQSIVNGGVATNTIVNNNGSQDISSGGAVTSTHINNGGTQNISSGGIADWTTISNNATQNISNVGIASNTTIYSNGTQNILSGGTANTVINQGNVNLSSGGVLSNYSGTGNLHIYGDNNLTGTIDIGGGKMIFADNTSATMNVENLSANGAVISMGVNLTSQTADQLVVSGVYNGDAQVALRNTGTVVNPMNEDGIKLVDFDDMAIINGTFDLVGGQWDEGGYVYKMSQNTTDNDYYLRNTGDYSDTFKTMANIPMLNAVVAKTGMNSLNKRMGDLRDMNNPANKQGVWVRTYYKDATVDDLLKTDMSLFGVEAGYDWLFNAEDPTKLYAGVMLGYIKADSIKTKTTIGDSNNGKGDAPSVGIYATLANENGWFIDLAARNFWSKIENTTHTSSGSTLKFDAKRDLITGSLEVGKSFTADNGFKVEPKVEVSYMNTGKETTPVTGGTGNLEYDAENYLTGKAAIMFAYKKEMANKMLIEPLVELAYNHEFNGKGKVRYGGAETETSLKGGSFEAAAGLSMQLADNLYWHALGSYEKGSKISGWGLNAGIRLGFGGNYSENEKSYKNKNKYPNNSHSDK